MSDNGVKYVSPHPPGNFHAIRDQPKLDGNLLGRAATSSTLMLGEIVDAGADAKWGKILDLLDAKTKLHDGVESEDVLVGAWIMIKNGDTILLRPDESSEKVEESSPVAQKRPSDISTPWATPFHKKESVTEEEELDEAVDNHTFFRGDNVGRTVVKAKDVQGTREKASLKEGFDGAARFQKLANIKK